MILLVNWKRSKSTKKCTYVWRLQRCYDLYYTVMYIHAL